MSTLALPMTSPASPKRSYEEADLGYINLGNEDQDQTAAFSQPPMTVTGAVFASPQMPLPPSIEAAPSTSSRSTPSMPVQSQPPNEKPAKRVKLSTAEKEGKKIEKEAKDRQKAEEKARKEEEKAKKDAEKAKKDAEKAAKDEERRKVREAKEEQIKLKEEERQKKEDEKNKKARSQLRLNAFFQQPSNTNRSLTGSPAKSPAKGNGPSPMSSRRSSIAEINAVEAKEVEPRSRSVSILASPSKSRFLDYKKCFPEFFVQSHTVLAPQNRFSRDARGFPCAETKIDQTLLGNDDEARLSSHGFNDLLRILPRKFAQKTRNMTMKEVVDQINGSSRNPIDLTKTASDSKMKPTDSLETIPIKFIKFAEDVRPPYIGTYTKTPKSGSLASLGRNPYRHVRPDTNYDWDSEAEWEDPVDGEDLDSEGEEEDEDEDEEEMEGFLDDEEPNAVKRRPLLGADQEPACSGICWEGQQHSSEGSVQPDHAQYRIDILLAENPLFPIDPFSISYWAPVSTEKDPSARIPNRQSTLMEPPRIPLSPVNRSNILLQPTINPSTNKAPKAPKRFIDPEVLDDFKQAIVGSDLTKMGLCEILKKRFPKQKKDAIKDTLEAVAERVGEKAAEKKWVLKNGI